jgi:AraC-like DNA-binding protein
VNHDRASGSLAAAAADAESDVLSDVLQAVRLTGALFFVVDARPPWVAEAPESSTLGPVILPRAQHVVSYHVVTEGPCWCHLAGRPATLIETGDAIVIPHGDAYALSSAPDASLGMAPEEVLSWFREMASGRLPFVVEEGGVGSKRLQVICGFLGCDALPFNPILSALPRLLHLRRPEAVQEDRLRPLVELAVGEARTKRPGSRSVLLRIAELLFVEVVRRHVSSETDRDTARGWLAGLRDPFVGRALAYMHHQPARAWTLDDLARKAAISRSVLTERFTQFVGEPPMHYLAKWRMQLAARLLMDPSAKVSAVAREVGYDSEAAFSRAFKKLTGAAPAVWRSQK